MKEFLEGKVVLHNGDCIDIMASMPDASIDSIVCDPPYGIGFMGKQWDTPGALVERKADTSQRWDHVGGNHNPSNSIDQARTRLSEGRKFGAWCEVWASQAFRVLKPGGHVVAFSGTRTYHRMACAIEDVGFEIRDQIGWCYGSGFPKSRNIGDGWGTALKPAWEPICLARKPLTGTVAANVLEHGTGALDIDGCRVEGGKDVPTSPRRAAQGNAFGDLSKDPGTGGGWDSKLGRWPANIVHDGSDEVLAAFPDTTSGTFSGHRNEPKTNGVYGAFALQDEKGHVGDSGSAARFFYTAKADAEDRLGSKHPTVKPLDLMQWLVRLVTPKGGVVLDPFAGTGTTGEAAWREGMRAILIEREAEYQSDIARRMELAENPTKRAAVAKSKNKLDDPNGLPLFAQPNGEIS